MPNHNKTIPTIWIKSTQDPAEREAIAEIWQHSSILQQLKTIIEGLRDEVTLDTFTDYSTPNWAVIRADKNGQIVAYNEILKLLP